MRAVKILRKRKQILKEKDKSKAKKQAVIAVTSLMCKAWDAFTHPGGESL